MYPRCFFFFMLELCNKIITSCIFVNSWWTFRRNLLPLCSRYVQSTRSRLYIHHVISHKSRIFTNTTVQFSNLSQKYVVVTMEPRLNAGLTFHRQRIHQKSRIVRTSLENAFRTFVLICPCIVNNCFLLAPTNAHITLMYRVIQKDGLNWTVNGASTQLVIPTTNSLPRWRLNVETKTKRTLHSSRRLSFNELTNAKFLC